MDDVSTIVQVTLTMRAFLYFVLFSFAGYLTMKTNKQNYKAVTFFGMFLFIVGIINLAMTFEWLSLFYW